MKILMISGDRNILKPDSAVAGRMVLHGRAVDEIHIIIPCEGEHIQLGTNVFVHPTGTSKITSRISSIVRTGKTMADIHLITAQDPFEYGIAGLRLGKMFNAPVELQVHTDIGSPYFFRETKNKIRKIGLARRFKRAAGIRVVSERVAHAVEGFGVGRSRVSVLPMFIDVKKFESVTHTPSSQEKSILMAGRLEKEKEYPIAFRAFARVLKMFPDAHLYIAGEGRLHARLASYAQKHNIGHAVTFLGAVPDITPHLVSAHVFLHTSRYEGFGVVLAEAGLVGTPIVSTNVGIAGGVLRDGEHGRVVPVGDVEKIAHALSETFSHPQKAHERALSAMGVIQKELLSSEMYIQKLKSIWSSYITT